MLEIIAERQENSKTYGLGNGEKQLRVSIGAIHYRDNYANKSESWKDIDLTWVNNKITKAPYILTRDSNKYTIKNKKSGEVSTIEVLGNNPNFEVVPDLDSIKFRHTVDNLPFLAQFKVTGNFRTRAFDDEGELELQTTLANGILTEVVPSIKDKHTKKLRPLKGKLKVDPTWQVGASSDDVSKFQVPDSISLTSQDLPVGAVNESFYRYGSGMRFTNITIAKDTTIDSGTKIIFTCDSGNPSSATNVKSRISAEDVDNAVTFADDTGAFDTRYAARTTARVDFDDIETWLANVEYDSPEIKTVIQEIVDRGSWSSGNAIVIFWEDYDDRTAHSVKLRYAASWNRDSAQAPQLVITYTVAGAKGKSANMAAKMMARGLL